MKASILDHVNIADKLLKVTINANYQCHVLLFRFTQKNNKQNRGVIVSVTDSGQIKELSIGICCFSDKYAALKRKNKHLLPRNQDNVLEWVDMSIHGLLFL